MKTVTLNRREKIYAALATAVIVFFLFMQAAETFRFFCPGTCAPYFWPFINYPMYNRPQYEGVVAHQYTVYGLTNNNEEIVLDHDHFGLDSSFKFNPLIVHLQRGDHDAIEWYATLYAKYNTDELIQLRVEDAPGTVLRDGVSIELDPQLILTYDLEQ